MEEAESSEEEDDAFSYYLIKEDVEKVWGQQYMDFGAIHRQHLKSHYYVATLPNHSHSSQYGHPTGGWIQTFMAFKVAHLSPKMHCPCPVMWTSSSR